MSYGQKYRKLMGSLGPALKKAGLRGDLVSVVDDLATGTDEFWSESLEKHLTKGHDDKAFRSLLGNLRKKLSASNYYLELGQEDAGDVLRAIKKL